MGSDNAADSYPVHFALSNQSRSHPSVTLRMSVDGAPTFDAVLETKGQHEWHELMRTLRAGSHVIEVHEAQTGAGHRVTVDVGQETWVTVMFTAPPPTCSVTAQNSPVAFI